MKDESHLVYTTEAGKMCPRCRKPVVDCRCRKATAPPQGDGFVRLRREVKGRKGKGVTLVTGLPLGGSQLKALARQLKQACGCGGTVKKGAIEIQGDHQDRLAADLKRRGYAVKRGA